MKRWYGVMRRWSTLAPSQSCLVTELTNSVPLSLWMIFGKPNVVNTSKSVAPMVELRLSGIARRQTKREWMSTNTKR